MKTKLLLAGTLVLLLGIQVNAQSNLWALTRNGGNYSGGSIISMDPSNGSVVVRHSFQPPAGYTPYGNLLQANDGNLYGTCYNGGSFASCTIFRFEPGTGTYTDVYDFDIIHGDFPTSGLIQGPGNILYGVASDGGANFAGVLYSYNTFTSVYSVVYDFDDPNGAVPYGAPTLHSNGKLYGLTRMGGTHLIGVLYSYDLNSSIYTMHYAFNTSNGYSPYGSLLEASNGKLYGLTAFGGLSGDGVLFSFDPVTNVFTKEADMNTAGCQGPEGSLIEASDGLLYGTTEYGGFGNGTIFSYDITTDVLTSIYNFNPIDGALPIGDLYEHGGFLYGTAFHGGMSSKGTAYKLSLPGYVFTKLIDFNGTNGSNPSGAFIIHMPTGLQSVAESEIGIYPNPVISDLMIILPEKFTSGVKVSITDLAGKAVREKSFSYLPQKSLQLDVQTLQSGVYFLNLESGDESLKQKFLKY